jgi:small subunit ribosomal protein S6
MPKPITVGRVLSVASRVGTQREYETVVILRPETGKPEISELIGRMQDIYAKLGARLLKIDSWGMRVLAFPIQHCRKGIYLYWRYLGGSDIVAELERNLRLHDKVIRFYTVRVDEDIDPEARPSEVTDALLDAAAEPGPDPDDFVREEPAEEEPPPRSEYGEGDEGELDEMFAGQGEDS